MPYIVLKVDRRRRPPTPTLPRERGRGLILWSAFPFFPFFPFSFFGLP
jgi:hypothetical protein